MTRINLELSDEVKALIDKQVAAGGYKSINEYFEHLLRKVEEKRQAKAEIEAEVLKGLASGPAKKMTDADWDSLHRKLEDKVKSQANRK